MKRNRLPIILVLVVLATLIFAGPASAGSDPPKQSFYFRWLWFLDYSGCELRVTGSAAHCPDDYYQVAVTSADPLFTGALEFWFDQNMAQPNAGGWFDRSNGEGGWRLQPATVPDGWWAGELSTVGHPDEYFEPIAMMNGRGYGSLEGYQIKGRHWQEPDDGTSWFGVWPANGGEYWFTGKGK